MTIRPAAPQDALAVARVHVRSWQAAYRGLLPEEYLLQLRPEDRAAHYDFSNDDRRKPFTQVAVEDGAIVGFATTMPSRDQERADHGELCALYVDPVHWGCGMGVTLLEAARRRLVDLGAVKALLWVLAGNARAEAFYRRNGWLPDGSRRTETVWDVAVEELRYVRTLA